VKQPFDTHLKDPVNIHFKSTILFSDKIGKQLQNSPQKTETVPLAYISLCCIPIINMHSNLRRHNNLYLLCIQILITHTTFKYAYKSLNTHINYAHFNIAYKS